MGLFGAVDSYDNKGPVGGATNPLTGAALARDRENQRAILELDGTQAYESISILDGSISPKRAEIVVDTEDGASADTLEAILTNTDGSTTLHDGMKLTLRSADPSRSVTVKHSNAEFGIQMVDGQDVILGTKWGLKLKLVANKWFEDQGRAEILASEAMDTAEEALGRTSPATTTSRGIARVATLADMEPGAVVENGPAFLDAETVKITPTPTANAVPQADASGLLDEDWLPPKANTSLDNITALAKDNITWLASPGRGGAVRISVPPSGGNTTSMPGNGWLKAEGISAGNAGNMVLQTLYLTNASPIAAAAGVSLPVCIKVSKGQTVGVSYFNMASVSLYFIYDRGAL